MNYSNPANLAIIACPGGEVFADEVISHLKKGYKRNIEKMAAELSKRYGMDPDTVIKRINFINEIINPSPHLHGSMEKFKAPHFKTPVKFTCFANGEVKAEILESIRGRDVYIFQDVENHYPVSFSGSEVRKVLSVNDHLMTIFVTIDAVRQAGAQRVTAPCRLKALHQRVVRRVEKEQLDIRERAFKLLDRQKYILQKISFPDVDHGCNTSLYRRSVEGEFGHEFRHHGWGYVVYGVEPMILENVEGCGLTGSGEPGNYNASIYPF
jgi:hypothetical protein